MSRRFFLWTVLVLCAPTLLQGEMPSASSGNADLLQAKLVCARLVGLLSSETSPVLSRLRPLALSPAEIDDGQVICSAGCVAEVHLRGGLLLRYGWANIPRGWPGYEDDPRVAYTELLLGRKQRRIFFRQLVSRSPGT